MSRRASRTAVAAVALVSCLSGCATVRHRTRVLDVPARAACNTDHAETRVYVRVIDEEGRPLRGIHVHMLQVQSWSNPTVETQQRLSDEQGRVSFDIRSDGYYAVVAASIGFTVEERFFLLKSGCDVSVVIPLRVLHVTDVM